MKIAICDDTELDLKHLYNLITEHFNKNNIPVEIETFTNPNILLNKISIMENEKFDLFFLDIIMQMNGINVASEIRKTDKEVPIIFTTTSKEYAIDAFKVNALDYLLKPISKNDFLQCIDKITEKINKNIKKSINFKTDNFTYVTIDINDIAYIEQSDRRVAYHMNNNKIYYSTTIRSKFIESIPFDINAYNFLNCHHSYILNMNYIKSIDDFQFTMKNGECIPISKRILKEVRNKYLKYLLGE